MFTPRTSIYDWDNEYFLCSFESVYLQRYKAVTPLGCSYLNICALFLAELEATAFLILTQITFPKMPRTGSIRVKANNSTRNFAPSSAKTVSYRKFEIEKKAKNEAYYFILSNGLLEEFMKFCKNYRSSDPHKDCLKVLFSEI